MTTTEATEESTLRPDGDPASGSGRDFRTKLAIVAGIGLVWRLLYLFISKVDETELVEQGDAFWYATISQNLARGEFFRSQFENGPTAEHPPLTVLVLGPASWLFEMNSMAQRLTMVLLGTLTIIVIGYAAKQLAGPRVGLASAVVAAIAPALWINDVLVMSETVSALTIALTIWAAVALSQRPTARLAVVAGVCCALAGLARAEAVLLIPLMIWIIATADADLPARRRVALSAMSVAAFAAVLAPWVALNMSRFDEPVLISTNDGLTLAGSNCDESYNGVSAGGWSLFPCVYKSYAKLDEAKTGPAQPEDGGVACPGTLQERLPCLDPSVVAKELRNDGIEYALDHKGDLPRVAIARNARVWGAYQIGETITAGAGEGRARWASWASFAFTWVTLPLAAVGLFKLRHKGTIAPFVVILAIAVFSTTAFTGLTPRIRLPWDVASCILIGAGALALWDRYGPSATATATAAPTTDA